MEKEITTSQLLDAINQLSIKTDDSIKNLSDRMEKKFEASEAQTKASLEATSNEILSAVNKFADDTEKRFNRLEEKVGGLEEKVDSMDVRLNRVEALMVTKDYLDDKLGDLRGDIIVTIRKEDVKVRKLIEILQNKNMLSGAEVKEILSMEPFPQLYL